MKRRPMRRTNWLRTSKRKQKQKSLAMRVAEICGTAFVHKRSAPSMFRSEKHRKAVAALPCIACGREKRSQAAHLNFVELGKGMGIKLSDALCIPLCCDGLGFRGCHGLLDQGGVYDNATAKALQLKWLQETRIQMQRTGDWPEAAENDVVKILGAYLQRQGGSNEKCSASAATDPSGDQI